MTAAAFYDLDGTLVRTNLVHSYLYNAANQPSLTGTLLKTLGGVARIPMFWAVDQYDRVAFNEILFSQYQGEYEDRLRELAADHFTKVLEPAIYPGAYTLVAQSKKRGLRQILVSGNLDIFVQPLAEHLGIDDIITNRLEFKKGKATGKLIPPVLAGATKARFIQEYARDHSIDLLASYGYSDSYSDYPMLAVIGRPAAVNPDRRLLRAARSFDWPVLDLSREFEAPSER